METLKTDLDSNTLLFTDTDSNSMPSENESELLENASTIDPRRVSSVPRTECNRVVKRTREEEAEWFPATRTEEDDESDSALEDLLASSDDDTESMLEHWIRDDRGDPTVWPPPCNIAQAMLENLPLTNVAVCHPRARGDADACMVCVAYHELCRQYNIRRRSIPFTVP